MLTLPSINFTTQLTPAFTGATDDSGAGALKLLYALDDNSCVFFDQTKIRTPGIQGLSVWVIDASGAITWYRTINLGDNGAYISSILALGAGLFSVVLATINSGQTWSFNFSVWNAKLNNASPLLIYPSGGGLTNACGSNEPIKIFYDSVTGIIGAGFYTTSGQNTNVSASHYKVNPGSLGLFSQGYVGTFPVGGNDPWNQTTSLGGAPYKTGSVGNGATLSLFTGGFYALGVNSYYVWSGSPTNNCNPANPGSGAYVQNRTNQKIITPLDSSEPFFVDSNVPNIFGIFTWGSNLGYGALIAPSPDLFFWQPFGFTVPGGPWNSVHTCVVTRKYVFAMGILGSFPAIIRTSGPPQGLYTANALAKNKYGLVNFVRPVSVIGKYKA